MLDISRLSENDRRLVEECDKVTNPIDWYLVPDEKEAESPEVKEYLHRHAVYLSLREEGEWI